MILHNVSGGATSAAGAADVGIMICRHVAGREPCDPAAGKRLRPVARVSKTRYFAPSLNPADG